MINPKSILVSFGINQEKFGDRFLRESEIQKYLRVFSLQILSVQDYLFEVINSYRFFSTGLSYRGIHNNFPEYFRAEDGAEEQKMFDLADSFAVVANSYQDILFLWESLFIEKTTSSGLEKFLKLKIKYEVLKRFVNPILADEVTNVISLKVYDWYDEDISEFSSNVYTNDNNNFLSIYLEIILDKKYFSYLKGYFTNVAQLFNDILNRLALSIKIKFIEIIWR